VRPERGSYTPPIMARVPIPSNPLLADWTARAFDQERKLIRALVELGQIAGRDVAVVGTRSCDPVTIESRESAMAAMM